MKTLLRKSNNKVFDNLLRSQLRRPEGSGSACPEFDPDRANAYIERGLAGVERTRYELHLSDCAGCRTSVVALARMADTDSMASPVPNVARNLAISESGWLASLKTGLWVIASPRWAIVATALLVIGISVPLLLSQKGERLVAQDTQVASNVEGTEPERDTLRQQKQEATQVAQVRSTAPQPAQANPSAVRDALPRKESASGLLSVQKSDENGAAGGNQPAAESPERKKIENGNLADARDDAKTKEASDKVIAGASAPAPAPTVEEPRTKISKADALRVPPENERSVRVNTLKQGSLDAGPKTDREKDAIPAITAKASEAPKHKAALEGEPSPGLTRGARSRLIGGDTRADRSNSAEKEKKVGKKTFWLSRGVWTDSEYNSDKKLPVVTVVRDSDVYKELLGKNNKLKEFLQGFQETDRAIIVFKSTVYSLIPQSDNK